MLSDAALQALVLILNGIEQDQRWPGTLRGVAAIALAKKTGGSRLIGVTGAVYRLWAKLRYDDVREQLEARLARPFMSAAPGIGAERAAVEAALNGELAIARGEVSATTLVDLKKYYEQIGFGEFANGSAAVGIPRAIANLALHLYAGPRRVKVGKAWSAPAFLARSLLLGCTWAMVLIRAITIGPAERLIARLREKGEEEHCKYNLGVSVDDVQLTTAGRQADVARTHPWATRLLVDWVQNGLRKKLAEDKKQCVAAPRALRQAIQPAMTRQGFKVLSEGEFLGADFSAGGTFRRRRALKERARKAAKRKGRLRW